LDFHYFELLFSRVIVVDLIMGPKSNIVMVKDYHGGFNLGYNVVHIDIGDRHG
jgi:hypothetical protein